MAFSNVADTTFTWKINPSELSSTDKKCSLSFTTSLDPKREWHLVISEKRHLLVHSRVDSRRGYDYNYYGHQNTVSSNKWVFDLKLVCDADEISTDPADIKVDISTMIDSKKNYTRSLIVPGNETEFVFNNFITDKNGEIELFVEMFLKIKEEEEVSHDFDPLIHLKFLCDVTILFKEDKFYAHKAVLATKSPYFYNLFKQNTDIKEIDNLNGIKPDAFAQVLRYIYTDKVNNCNLNGDILMAASVLQIENLKTKCEQVLRNNITLDFVCPILILASECNAKVLLESCLHFVTKNVNLISETGNFKCLKTKEHIILSILNEIFQLSASGKLTIDDNICHEYEKSATNTSCSLLEDYQQFFNNENLSDINIHVGEKIFSGHKVVLAAKSQVFLRMFMTNMKESRNNFITIEGIEAPVFDQVLRYIYTGKVENLEEHAIEILQVAEQYNLDHLKKLCEEFLAEKLTHDNVVHIVKIADTFQASLLRQCCIYYIVKQKVFYSQTEEGANIKLDSLVDNNDSNILFEILNVLSLKCDIKYIRKS